MPSSALVTQLFSSLMRVYRTFPPVAPKRSFRITETWRFQSRCSEMKTRFGLAHRKLIGRSKMGND
jgi:hypothetical protein